ncbi:hypothetical protein BH24ACT9_BH24ACT9_07850 [soil metagenome]
MTQPPWGPPPPPAQGGQPPYGDQPHYGGQPPYGGPPPYGGQPGFGQSGGFEQPYGQPYAAPGGDPYSTSQSPYGPPPTKSPLPWIIGGLVVLLVAGGIGLFFGLKDDDPIPIAATLTTEQTTQTSETEVSTEPSTEESTEETSESDELNFPDSPQTGEDFLTALSAQDYQAAFDLLTPSLQEEAQTPQAVADELFAQIGTTSVGDAEVIDAFGHGGHDDVILEVETDSGSVEVLLAIQEYTGALKIFTYEVV